jgi:hypothetical protein
VSIRPYELTSFNSVYSQYAHIQAFTSKQWSEVLRWQGADDLMSQRPISLGSGQLSAELQRYAEAHFAVIGKHVRLFATQFYSTWTRLALGHGPVEKTFAVALGYVVVALLLSIYLNILTVGSVRSAGRAVRSAVRQQLLILKVCSSLDACG